MYTSGYNYGADACFGSPLATQNNQEFSLPPPRATPKPRSASTLRVGWEAVEENTTTQTKETTSEARTSTLKAGGDLNRNAAGTLRDVGTQIEAGGHVTQTATEIDNRAATNTRTLDTSTEKERISVGQSIDYGVGDAIDSAEKGSTAGAAEAPPRRTQ